MQLEQHRRIIPSEIGPSRLWRNSDARKMATAAAASIASAAFAWKNPGKEI
jgi:hypothetical protein